MKGKMGCEGGCGERWKKERHGEESMGNREEGKMGGRERTKEDGWDEGWVEGKRDGDGGSKKKKR